MSYKKTRHFWRNWLRYTLGRFFGEQTERRCSDLTLEVKYFIHILFLRNLILKIKYFVVGVKNKKVNKKFIITLMEDPPSIEAAEKCRQSIRLHGGGNAQYFTAIDEHHSISVLKKQGVNWVTTDKYIFRKTEKLMGCFASHFLLWLKCIEYNEPIMIFESDALCTHTIPSQLRFRHVINLTDKYDGKNLVKKKVIQFMNKKSYTGIIYCIHFYIPGTVAYAISPEGARRLVKRARACFACEADSFINKRVVDVVEYFPLPVRLNTDYPSYFGRQEDS